MSKQVKLQVGVGKKLKQISVDIPDNAPRPWDGNDELCYVGKKFTRLEGREKTTGAARFTFDIKLPGMLHAVFLRSGYAAALIKKIDSTKAMHVPGVRAILPVQDTMPMEIRYAGQEILAIAADTIDQAQKALKLVEIEYEERAFVLNADQAKKSGSPKVFPTKVVEKKDDSDTQGEVGKAEKIQTKGNVRGPVTWGVSPEKIDNALKNADVVIDQEYRTQVQTHSAMEPHGAVVQWESENKLTVWVSTQGIFSVRDELATVFNLPKTNVQVISEHTGGGFGAKLGAGIYGVTAARLAKKTNKPVRMIYNRKEEHLAGGNRPDSVQNIKIAASKAGKIQAIELESYGTSGAGTGAGTAGPAKFIYQCSHIRTEESDVFTNASPGTYFRGPGHPQGVFALEQAVDELAYKLAIDPLELRRINTLHHDARQAEYKIGAEKFGWNKRNPKPGADSTSIKRGMGMANSLWYYFYGLGYQASIQVNNDGSIELTNGVQDIGTGVRTLLGMIVAEELEMTPGEIKVTVGNSRFGSAPPSGGSQTTAGISPAVRNAAYLAKRKMMEIAAPLLGVTVEKLQWQKGKVFVADSPSKTLNWKQIAGKIPGDTFTVIGERVPDYHKFQPATIAGMQFADIEVDTETGIITVKKILAVHDCGRIMNRLTLESQINGGVIQGISYALYENRVLDGESGIMLNANFEQYKIAGALDIPEIESVFVDVHRGQNSTGAIGIGEPATIPTSAAIANAFYHATGARIRELPMTPDKVLAALAK